MRVVATADRVRRWWLWRLGRLGRVLVAHRELRVAVVFGAVTLTALLGTVLAPLWLLALGPMVWGVPHVVADIRYLVVRTGFGRRRGLWVVGGVPLLWVAGGGDLWWGFVGAAAVALRARARIGPRLLAAALLLGSGALLRSFGGLSDIIFGHVHNFAAVALWWIWRPRRQRLHWFPLALLVAAAAFLLSPLALELTRALGALDWHAPGLGTQRQLWRLAPGLDADMGLRLVLLFCFMQSVHYALWLQMIPDEARGRSTVMTFRASYRDLQRDLGTAAIFITLGIAVWLVAWALIDLGDANRGYFRMVRFHGHLEIMAGVLLILEARR